MSDRLDTGEAIRVILRADGRYQATVDIEIHGAPIAHHAVETTPERATDKLRYFVAALRGQDTSAFGGRWRMPPLICDIKGQGRRLQCARPGTWPEHIPTPPAVETRCTACDDYKAKAGILEREMAAWDRPTRGTG